MKKTIVDPPYGWRYNFPKALPEDVSADNPKQLRAWLISEGYPEKDIDFAMSYCRFWEQNEDEK